MTGNMQGGGGVKVKLTQQQAAPSEPPPPRGVPCPPEPDSITSRQLRAFLGPLGGRHEVPHVRWLLEQLLLHHCLDHPKEPGGELLLPRNRQQQDN
jgi:hypothetical protein